MKLDQNRQIKKFFHLSNHSLQKQYKTDRKTLKNKKSQNGDINYFSLTQRVKSNVRFFNFVDLTSDVTSKQIQRQTKNSVDCNITHNFHKSNLSKAQSSLNLRLPDQKSISNKRIQINYYSSQKKQQKLFKRPLLSKSTEGPSFWTYDPKPQKLMRKVAKQLTFSKNISQDSINSKKEFNSTTQKAKSLFSQKSNNNSTNDMHTQKDRPKLKKKAVLSDFLKENQKEKYLQKQNHLQLVIIFLIKQSLQKRKRSYEQNLNHSNIKRDSKELQKIQYLGNSYRKSILLKNPYKIGEADKVYESQRRKYHIRQSSCGFIKNVRIAELVKIHFNEQQMNSSNNFVTLK